MKKIQREIKAYEDVFVSADGKEFKNEADCREWEKSYKCTLEASWKTIKKIEVNSVDLGLPWSSDDHECYLIKPKSLEEITIINAYVNGTTCNYDDAILDMTAINKVVALNFGYDHDYCDAFVMDNFLERIANYITVQTEKLEEKQC